MHIVPISEIPKGEKCPSDLLKLYKTSSLLEELCEQEDGIGLSAVQTGIPWNLFVVKFYDNNSFLYKYYVDCSYTPVTDDKEKSVEGCLSLKNNDGTFRHFEVERYKRVRIKGKELANFQLNDLDFEIEGFYGVVLQHEIDHANQILISDIGKEYIIY